MQRPLPLTFACFLPLPENRSALAAVHDVARSLSSNRCERAVNPLYLYGPAGLGKSHLASALAEEVSRRRDLAVRILPAGDFEMPGAPVPEGDLVIFEDIQLLKPTAVEACVQVFDDLHARQIQMVFTAAVGPRWLPFANRLKSRLASGLVVSLEPLQPPSRLALLQDKAQRRQLAVSRAVLAWLAEHLPGGGRQLEGALAILEGLAREARPALDVATVARHFRLQAEACQPTMERIAAQVSKCFHVKPHDLQSSQRTRSVLLPRQVGMYLARQLTDLSLAQIGTYFGGRDHTTVLHACRKVEQALVDDPGLTGTVRQLQSEFASTVL